MTYRPIENNSLPASPGNRVVTQGTHVHGSAHWMNASEADSAGLNAPVGVVLGQKSNGELLRFAGDGHIMVFAPSGAGKGIGFVQPNLHDYRGSLVCLDPKGENAIVAAEHRRRMGQQVIVLDPFGPHEERNGRVWLNSGFGVPYRVWADAGYPLSMLEELHSNLLMRRAEMREYVREYAQRVFRAAGG